jgi:hypothetical protein
LAREWVAEHIPVGSTVFTSPFYVADLGKLPITLVKLANVGSRQFRLPRSIGAGLNAEEEPLFEPALLRLMEQRGTDYVVLNSYFEDGLAATPENLRWFRNSVREYQAFLVKLKESADMVYEVEGYSAGRYGPDVTIYRLRR